jgi:hypothetical protein
MDTGFDPSCGHHVMLMTPPVQGSLTRMGYSPLYHFGCADCPGRITVPAADMKGKDIPGVFAAALEKITGRMT